MTDQILNLEFLWLLNKEDSSELNEVLAARSGEGSLALCKPELKLKKDLSSFCGFPIFIGDCKKRVEFSDNNGQDSQKKSHSLFYLEFLFNVFCTVKLERNPEEDFRRFVNLFCSTKLGRLSSEVYLKSSSIPFAIEKNLATGNREIDVTRFSLGNFVGLNTFYERFDSKTSIEKEKYKITQVKLLLLHDYKKLLLYFLVGKNCPVKKRNATTHRWYKLELLYASLYSMVISKNDSLVVYIRTLLPPLMYSVIQNEDKDEDCVPFYEIDHRTSWFRAVDLYENCPFYLGKEFSMNAAIRLEFKCEEYDFLFQLMTHCKSIQMFFAPVTVIKSPLPPVNLTFQLKDFECFYALQCLLTHSFEISDQLVVRKEDEKVKKFLQEKCKENPVALSSSLYLIFDAVIKGNVVIFKDCVEYLFESLRTHEPKTVTDNFSTKKSPQDNHLLNIKRAILTPTHFHLLPPQPTLKSRALRDCQPDYSLRVSLKDTNMDSINFSAKAFGPDATMLQRSFFNNYFRSPLLKGLTIGERNYKYVGSSTSQLKGHGLWFYAKDTESRTADDLRREFGKLEKIRHVPKYMARMGQTFSQSLGFIKVPQEWTNVKDPEQDIEGGVKEYLTFDDPKDVKKKKFLKEEKAEEDIEAEEIAKEIDESSSEPYVFSDGIGRISAELAEEIYEMLNLEDERPSAFQIRYAGCKGMLVIDPRLEGKKILFRKSMKKFDSDHDSLEILKYSEKRCCFLNRPFITILEQLGIGKEVFLQLQKEMIQKHISSMFHDWEAYHFLNRHALLRFDFLRMYTAGIHFTEDPLFRSMIYAIFQKQLELLKNKANIEVPENKGRNMFGVMDDTFTLEYGQIFVQYSDWDSDQPIIIKGTVVVTKNPCMHPGDVRKFEAVDVKELHHIVDCIVFPAKGPRPHPDEMAGSDLDGDEYQVMWMEQFIFSNDNHPPMPYALKDKPKELDRPVMVTDELDHLCEYIFNDKVGLIASSHLVWADQVKGGIFSDTCIRLAKQYSIALDFAKSGKTIPKHHKDRAFKYPDFMQKLDEKKTYLSTNALGILFRSCKRLELGLDTERNEIEYKLDNALVHEKWDSKYKKSALRIYKQYCDKIEYFLRAYGFENEGQLLAGALINPPKYYENRHDLSNLMSLIEFEVQFIFRNLEQRFFEEFGGKPKDGVFTDNMYQKASAWYMVTYSKSLKKATHFFGFPWAVSDVLAELKKKNKGLSAVRSVPSKSLLEEIVDKSVSKHFKNLNPDTDSMVIYENRISVLEVADKMLTKWIKSQRDYFSDPDIRKVERCVSKEFHIITQDIVAGDARYIDKLKRDMNIKRAVSPSHNVIETMLHIAGLSTQVPLSQLSDIRQELGLLAWVTLVKLACTYNPQYLGVPNEKGEYAKAVFYKSQDNIIDTIQLPLFEKNDALSTKFSMKITHEMEEVKQYLKQQTKLKDIDFRIISWRDGSDYVRITVEGTRYSIERLKDIVVMDEFFHCVANNKPLYNTSN